MENILNVANYIVKKYKEISGDILDEMKLHKLLYFTQRETFAVLGKPAFAEEFEAWKYGPVSRLVRNDFVKGEIVVPTEDISDEIKYIVNNVILEYGALESWKLSEISHKEKSWQNARVGLTPTEIGTNTISIDDIQEDAKKVRPYDHIWDMYYDEFDDEEP